ncbi:MAG: MATE family efflux transporter [Clostridium sp.]|jgi:putative MATE family efflux protein|nr:MATE family efflux transporter [Clostridium sp.]
MELDMTKGKPLPLLLKFMIPVVIGSLFQQLYNMADTMIVGRYVGVRALAAVGATGSVSFLILGFAVGMTMGFTVMTAQRFGAGDLEGMKKSVGSAVLLSVAAAVLLTAASLAGMSTLLAWMHTPEDILPLSKEYLTIICAGLCGIVSYNLLASILRAIGNSVAPLILLLISSVVNVALDLVFVAGLGMGVAGAAYATVISQGLADVLCVIYIIRKVPSLRIGKRHWKPEGRNVKNQLAVGVPMALQFSITAVGTILVQGALNLLGSMVVASYSVSSKIEQLVTQPFAAMGVTMATYCAQNRGVDDIGRIREGVRLGNVISAAYAVAVYGVVYLILPFAIRLFVTQDVELIYGYARTYIVINGACFIPLGMIFLFRNALQGCGYGFLPMMGGVVELVCRAAVAFIAARMLSYRGVCFANGSTWLTTGIFFWIVYHVLMKKLARRQNGKPVQETEGKPGAEGRMKACRRGR